MGGRERRLFVYFYYYYYYLTGTTHNVVKRQVAAQFLELIRGLTPTSVNMNSLSGLVVVAGLHRWRAALLGVGRKIVHFLGASPILEFC